MVYIAALAKGSGMIAASYACCGNNPVNRDNRRKNFLRNFGETWRNTGRYDRYGFRRRGSIATIWPILMANGTSNKGFADEDQEFLEALKFLMTKIAKAIAIDGEGATK